VYFDSVLICSLLGSVFLHVIIIIQYVRRLFCIVCIMYVVCELHDSGGSRVLASEIGPEPLFEL